MTRNVNVKESYQMRGRATIEVDAALQNVAAIWPMTSTHRNTQGSLELPGFPLCNFYPLTHEFRLLGALQLIEKRW